VADAHKDHSRTIKQKFGVRSEPLGISLETVTTWTQAGPLRGLTP
jgi:hypothetical protein